jgi:hypothetical protein
MVASKARGERAESPSRSAGSAPHEFSYLLMRASPSPIKSVPRAALSPAMSELERLGSTHCAGFIFSRPVHDLSYVVGTRSSGVSSPSAADHSELPCVEFLTSSATAAMTTVFIGHTRSLTSRRGGRVVATRDGESGPFPRRSSTLGAAKQQLFALDRRAPGQSFSRTGLAGATASPRWRGAVRPPTARAAASAPPRDPLRREGVGAIESALIVPRLYPLPAIGVER